MNLVEKVKDFGKRRPGHSALQRFGRNEPGTIVGNHHGSGKKRTLVQVKLEDMVAADKTFDILMGDQVEPRRNFIQTYAKQVRNLDI